MAVQKAVRVEGLADLRRAFSIADKTLSKELREGLKDAAEPVGADAESLARSRIRNIGIAWSTMRIGITRSTVYVAPKQRNTTGRKRKKLADLLLGRSMMPALEQNITSVTQEVDEVLATVGKAWERG